MFVSKSLFEFIDYFRSSPVFYTTLIIEKGKGI